MLDCGSKLTLLKSSIALQLKPDQQLDDTIQLHQALTSSDTASTKMTIAIGHYNQQKQPFQLNDIDVIMNWNLSQFNPELVNSICQRNEPLQHIRIATLPSKQMGIIIGCDFAELVAPSEVIHSKQNVPIGWKTPLGWSLCGRDNAATPNDINIISFTKDDTLFRHVAEWMKMDAEGISTDQRSLSTDDKEALRILESSTTRLPNGHYEVGMLWKRGQQLPNNRWLAKKQLDSLLQRLKRNTEMAEKYQETIDTDLQKGFIVKVDDSHEDSTGKWYLPHHPVTNINKPGKVRRVLNASSIYKGVSLNTTYQPERTSRICDFCGRTTRANPQPSNTPATSSELPTHHVLPAMPLDNVRRTMPTNIQPWSKSQNATYTWTTYTKPFQHRRKRHS